MMRRVLQERDLPVGRLRLFASERSAGQVLDGVTVEDVAVADHAGLDIALFSMGAAASHEWAPVVAGSGCHSHRQFKGLADGPRRAPGRARGQRRRPRPTSAKGSWPTPTAPPWCACRC